MDWKPMILADGLSFPEGPISLGGGEVVFTEIRGQRLSRYRDGRVELVAETGGGANGAVVDRDGSFYVANNGGLCSAPGGQWLADDQIHGRIQKIDTGGEVTDIAVDLPGAPPHRPNDLCFGPDGKIYFTDPHNWEDIRNLKPGRVNRTDLEGNVEQLAEVARFPNGIAFGLDGRLYVAESVTKHIWAYECSATGLGEPTAFCVLPTGYPDGFCFAANGNLIACGSLGDVICVFDPNGRLIDRYDSGEHTEPTNCCIGDGRLYVTYSGTGQLMAFDCDQEALPLHPFR